MSVTVKHTSAALTDILLAADKLREGCLNKGGRNSCSTLGRDAKGTPEPQELHRLTKHHSYDRNHRVGSCKTKRFEVGPACIHGSQGLAPKRLELDSKRRTSHRNPALAYSNRARGTEELSPKTLLKCSCTFLQVPSPRTGNC